MIVTRTLTAEAVEADAQDDRDDDSARNRSDKEHGPVLGGGALFKPVLRHAPAPVGALSRAAVGVVDHVDPGSSARNSRAAERVAVLVIDVFAEKGVANQFLLVTSQR